MTRRKLVALVGACVMLLIGLVVLSTGLYLTRTDAGRQRLADIGLPFVRSKLPHAKLYVGKIGGSLIGDVTIDSLEIRDDHNEIFAATGRVTLAYNWRDLIDLRINITKATIEHPFVHIIQHQDYTWNFKQVFAGDNKKLETPKPLQTNTRGIGDYIVIDSTTVHNGTFLLTLKWSPDDTLKGAIRDSVIRYHLQTPSKAVVKTFDGYGRLYAWRNGNGVVDHIRLADPDSDKFGREIKIGTLSVDEYDPTFQFRNVRGLVNLLGDTASFSIPRFDMPASTGSAKGRVWWGSDLPVRYAIDVIGDSVSLNDVNWVYPTLPRTGGGSLELVIKNDPANLQVVDFQLHKMDIRSTGSHLMGEMWFGTGAPFLLVRHVDLNAQPVTFDLLRTLAGKPFPYDWRGDIFGTVKARGGPLNHFYIDDARGRFEDAHVKGAVSRFAGKGELNINVPALTEFHGFNVDVGALDLRTIEFLNPAFPRVNGIVSGTATLDSSWLDVRFSNAHLALQDGPGEPSRASGFGRVTYGSLMGFDLTLNAEPLNATMLARSPTFSALPIRGLFSGPLRVQGMAPDLQISTTLQSSAGAFSFEGRADMDSIGGYGAHGHGDFTNVDLVALLEKQSLPTGRLSGHYELAVDSIGVTPSSVRGSASLDLERTVIDSVRVRESQARLRFVDGKMLVDSLNVRTDAFTAVATGGVGLPQGKPDSLHFTVYVDSLGGLRPLVSHPETLPGALTPAVDSLSGSARVSGFARGTLDALDLHAELFGSHLYFNKDRGDSVYARVDLQNALTKPTGLASARIDSVTVAGIALDTLGATLRLSDSTHRAFTFGAASRSGLLAAGGGAWTDSAAVQTIRVDSIDVDVGADRWRLTTPSTIVMDSAMIRVDSLVLRNRDSAMVAVTANIPETGQAFAQLRASAIPLPDAGRIAQLSDTLFGVGNLIVTATGTKAHPVIDAASTLANIRFAKVDVQNVTSAARYADGRVNGNLTATRHGFPAVRATASWPFDVTLFSVKQRNDSVRVSVNADTTEASLLLPLFPKGTLDSLSGQLSGALNITGTTAAKTYAVDGSIINVAAGVRPAGVVFKNINGKIVGGVNAAGEDSINVDVSAQTPRQDNEKVAGVATIKGWVADLAQQKARFSLSLTADSLHAFNKPHTTADVFFSTPTPIILSGSLQNPTLTGAINIDKGAIYLADPDLARKLNVETILDDAGGVRASAASPFTTLMTNLQIAGVPVTLGQDVRLLSSAANVRLAGSLNLVKSSIATRVIASTGDLVPGLSLEGQVSTVNGTYNLNLGIVQREFTVLSGGTVTFDAASKPETPAVDIRARYNVQQFRDRPLGVIVNLKGRLPNPTISFSSDADYTIDQSDLLSYLITGAPGFDFGTDQKQLIASVLSPTLSAVAADRLRQTLGSFVDAFQFELGTYDVGATGGSAFSSENIRNYLSTASIQTGYSVGSNVYLTVNAGVCGISHGEISGFGGSIEYRFRPDFSFQAAFEPGSQSRTNCLANTQGTLLGLIPTPGQFSFTIHRTWRF